MAKLEKVKITKRVEAFKNAGLDYEPYVGLTGHIMKDSFCPPNHTAIRFLATELGFSYTHGVDDPDFKYVKFPIPNDCFEKCPIEEKVKTKKIKPIKNTEIDIYNYVYQKKYYNYKMKNKDSNFKFCDFDFVKNVFLVPNSGFEYDEEKGLFYDPTTKYIEDIPKLRIVGQPFQNSQLKLFKIKEFNHLNDEWLNMLKYLVRESKNIPSYNNILKINNDEFNKIMPPIIASLEEKILDIEKNNTVGHTNKKIKIK